jgi:hypothetical protein
MKTDADETPVRAEHHGLAVDENFSGLARLEAAGDENIGLGACQIVAGVRSSCSTKWTFAGTLYAASDAWRQRKLRHRCR